MNTRVLYLAIPRTPFITPLLGAATIPVTLRRGTSKPHLYEMVSVSRLIMRIGTSTRLVTRLSLVVV